MTSDPARRKSRQRGRLPASHADRVAVVASALAALLAAPPLPADQLILANGSRLEGRVEPAGEGRVRVVVDEGQSVVVELSQVKERIAAEAPLDTFERRLGRTPRDDRDAFIETARWGEEVGVRRAARRAWREVLRLDPHHAGARNRLGYALHRNRWVLRDDLEAEGLELFRGTWMTPEEIAERRTEEGVAELEALLGDAGHDNRFVREDAMLRILSIDDPDLAPALRARLADPDPLRRMLCGRALANLGFEAGASELYAALLAEPRPEVRSAWAAALRALGRVEIARWLARDLAAATTGAESADGAAEDVVRRHSLLELARACPARVAVPALIDWTADPVWGPPAGRVLAEILDAPERTTAEWRAAWSERGDAFAPDLGSGWLGAPE